MSRSGRATATYGLAGALVLGYLAQFVTLIAFGGDAFQAVWVLQSDAPANLWTWVLYLFAHASSTTLVANLAWLLVFGRPIERAVGSRRFVGVFLGAGIVSGLFGLTVLSARGVTGGLVGSSAALLAVLVLPGPSNPRLAVRSRRIPHLHLAVVVGLCLVAVAELLSGRIAQSSPWIAGIVIGGLTGLWQRRSGPVIDELRLL